MARFLYLATRSDDNVSISRMRDGLAQLEKLLIPAQINPNPPITIESEGILAHIFNPVGFELVSKMSICTGILFDNQDKWDQVGATTPDGNYSIIRADDTYVEILSDFQATHTIWYYFDDEKLIISSSQRAIIALLGNYMPSRTAVSWMISSGTLGPGYSWDSRLKALRPSELIKLDRNNWNLSCNFTDVKFDPKELPEDAHVQAYVQAATEIIKSLPKGISYIQQLTGGFDSRMLLMCILATERNIDEYLTLGLESSKQTKLSDADIARRLCDKYRLNWQYHPTDFRMMDFEYFFDEFFQLGEGRLDNLERMQFGTQVWSNMFNKGRQVVIGGSDGFRTQKHYKTEKFIQLQKRLIRVVDISNLPDRLKSSFQLDIPEYLRKKDKETLTCYYHRLSQEYFAPYADAALNDFILPYMTIVNPLESKRVLEVMRRIPDKYRANKKCIKKYLRKNNLGLPFDKHVSIQRTHFLLEQEELYNHILTYLKSVKNTSDVLSLNFLDFITQRDTHKGSGYNLVKKRIKLIFPPSIRSAIRKAIKFAMNLISKDMKHSIIVPKRVLVFRTFIALKMQDKLNSDSVELDSLSIS